MRAKVLLVLFLMAFVIGGIAVAGVLTARMRERRMRRPVFAKEYREARAKLCVATGAALVDASHAHDWGSLVAFDTMWERPHVLHFCGIDGSWFSGQFRWAIAQDRVFSEPASNDKLAGTLRMFRSEGEALRHRFAGETGESATLEQPFMPATVAPRAYREARARLCFSLGAALVQSSRPTDRRHIDTMPFPHPDLLLFCGVDGRAFASTVSAPVPRLAISAVLRATGEDLQRRFGSEYGDSAFLKKPFDPP